MHLCVVIPARNEELRIGAQLEALLAQDFEGEWEIIVVDNGSTDGTVALVNRFAQDNPRLRVIEAPERADQSYAANTGVAASTADAVIFCDGDDVVMAGWLAAMARGLEKHEVVTGPNELDRLNPPWLADSRGRTGDEGFSSFAGIFPLVHGNNYGVRRDVWAKVGPLNEGYFPVADQEFSLRCWLNGVDVVYMPEARVHYRYRSAARQLWRQGWAYGSHRPMIASLLREHGKPRPRPFAGWKSWVILIVRIPTVATRSGRARWLWIAGNRFGQVGGSIKYRTLML